MSRSGPVNWGKTLHVKGDIHWGITRSPRPQGNGAQGFRLDACKADLKRVIRRYGTPLGTAQAGDLIDGQGAPGGAADLTFSDAYWGDWPIPYGSIPGNHDLWTDGSTPDTGGFFGFWGTRFTMPDPEQMPLTTTQWSADLGPFRLVAGDFRQTQGTFAAELDALLDADTSKPTVLMIHMPLRNSVTIDSERWGEDVTTWPSEADYVTDAGATQHGIPLAASVIVPGHDAFLARLAARPHVKVVMHGHTHNRYDNPGLAIPYTLPGGRVILSVNASSPYFQGPYNVAGTSRGPFGSDGIQGNIYLEMLDDLGELWAVYVRDVGMGVWTCLSGARRSAKVAVT